MNTETLYWATDSLGRETCVAAVSAEEARDVGAGHFAVDPDEVKVLRVEESEIVELLRKGARAAALEQQVDRLQVRLASQTERDGMEQANLRAQLDRARASEKRLAEAARKVIQIGAKERCGCRQCRAIDDLSAALSEMEGA